MKYLCAADTWLLDLTLDVLCMLVAELARAGAHEYDLHDPDDALNRSLRRISRICMTPDGATTTTSR